MAPKIISMNTHTRITRSLVCTGVSSSACVVPKMDPILVFGVVYCKAQGSGFKAQAVDAIVFNNSNLVFVYA